MVDCQQFQPGRFEIVKGLKLLVRVHFVKVGAGKNIGDRIQAGHSPRLTGEEATPFQRIDLNEVGYHRLVIGSWYPQRSFHSSCSRDFLSNGGPGPTINGPVR